MGQAIRPEFFIQVQHDFRIGSGGESVAFLDKLFSKLDIVEGFPVEDDPEGPIFVRDRLSSAVDSDDAEARACQTDPGSNVDAGFVGPPMPQSGNHANEGFFLDIGRSLQGQDARYAAHSLSP
jgi:hypothetical protein